MSKDWYRVSLVFTMESETPGDAVQDVVDTFTENGFRDLVYVVTDDRTGERIGYFNGWGEELDTSEVEARAARFREEPVVPGTLDDEEAVDAIDAVLGQAEADDATEVAKDDSDLEQLAAALNQE